MIWSDCKIITAPKWRYRWSEKNTDIITAHETAELIPSRNFRDSYMQSLSKNQWMRNNLSNLNHNLKNIVLNFLWVHTVQVFQRKSLHLLTLSWLLVLLFHRIAQIYLFLGSQGLVCLADAVVTATTVHIKL